jgi:hypothetical protein
VTAGGKGTVLLSAAIATLGMMLMAGSAGASTPTHAFNGLARIKESVHLTKSTGSVHFVRQEALQANGLTTLLVITGDAGDRSWNIGTGGERSIGIHTRGISTWPWIPSVPSPSARQLRRSKAEASDRVRSVTQAFVRSESLLCRLSAGSQSEADRCPRLA